eukprot:753541-Hanusia_phi.AAC.2
MATVPLSAWALQGLMGGRGKGRERGAKGGDAGKEMSGSGGGPGQADHASLNSKAPWWAEEVALESLTYREEEKERWARREVARLAEDEEQKRRTHEILFLRVREHKERLSALSLAIEMEEQERARRIQQRDQAVRDSLMEQEKEHLASLQSYLEEKERRIHESSNDKKIVVNRALEREKRRRMATDLVSKTKFPEDAAAPTISSSSLLAVILNKAYPREHLSNKEMNRSLDQSDENVSHQKARVENQNKDHLITPERVAKKLMQQSPSKEFEIPAPPVNSPLNYQERSTTPKTEFRSEMFQCQSCTR